ncbi:MAG: tRNA (adenosine(37)-N6)-threonylcarbamoyltransferase complex transferase subunit TsaD, partial [Bdellovibrionota bacterium]
MPFHVLGIESSCDETSAAVVRLEGDKITLLSDRTARQEEVHVRWGGVVPELASRRHLESLLPCVRAALDEAGLGYKDLNAVAVTNRPGLIGSLMIGVNGARSLCYGLGLPLILINHLEAHLAAVLLDGAQVSFPCLGLIISGGHTSLY